MKFTIITVVKNNKDGVVKAVDSVQSQTYKNLEHIIIDGNSADGTKEEVQKLQLKVENLRFVSELDSGVYDAINKGIKIATGDIVGLLHSDDSYYDSRVLEDVAVKFYQGADIVYGDLIYVSKNDNNKIVRIWRSGEFSIKKLTFGWMPPHPTLFIKRHLFESFGLYKKKFKISSDYDFILRIMSREDLFICYINRFLIKMQIGGISNRSIKNIIRKSFEDYLALKENNFTFRSFTLLCKNFRKLNQFFIK